MEKLDALQRYFKSVEEAENKRIEEMRRLTDQLKKMQKKIEENAGFMNRELPQFAMTSRKNYGSPK